MTDAQQKQKQTNKKDLGLPLCGLVPNGPPPGTGRSVKIKIMEVKDQLDQCVYDGLASSLACFTYWSVSLFLA